MAGLQSRTGFETDKRSYPGEQDAAQTQAKAWTKRKTDVNHLEQGGQVEASRVRSKCLAFVAGRPSVWRQPPVYPSVSLHVHTIPASHASSSDPRRDNRGGAIFRLARAQQAVKSLPGKKVVVFSMPGAFTPTDATPTTCPHEELMKEFPRAWVDQIVLCVGRRCS